MGLQRPDFLFGREPLQEHPAANRHRVLVQAVIDLTTLAAHRDQPGFTQQVQMMGNRGLADLIAVVRQPLHHVRDAQLTTAQNLHDLLAGFIRNDFGERK